MNPTDPGRNKDCPEKSEAYERVEILHNQFKCFCDIIRLFIEKGISVTGFFNNHYN